MSDAYLPADRLAYDDAVDLIARFGAEAAREAAGRARRSRNLGNVIGFCRWRQTERAIAALASTELVGALH